MTINIDKLRQALGAVQPEEVEELLDRLEAAENELVEIRHGAAVANDTIKALCAENAALVDDMNLLRVNNTALRAKVEQMEKQKPVEWQSRTRPVWNDGMWTQWSKCSEGYAKDIMKAPLVDDWMYEARPLYALPGAQPQLNEIKIALQRALGLGQRETWTGARKHRSWEDQREEQQCWNKVWNLLGAQGEEK